MQVFFIFPRHYTMRVRIWIKADIRADKGIVKIHAHTIFPATPQRTAVSLLVEPTPTMAPVIVCVVLTGMPAIDAPIIEIAAAVSAQKPPIG